MTRETEPLRMRRPSLARRVVGVAVLLGSVGVMGVSAWWTYLFFAQGDLKPASMALMGVFAGFFAFVWAWDFRQAEEDDLFHAFYGSGGKSSLGGKQGSGEASARYYPCTNVRKTERYKK